MTEYKYTPETNPYVLARMADCASPDSQTSPGAGFLVSVADAVGEHVDYDDDRVAEKIDAAHEIADNAVPIYTHDLWATFVDLAAYQEDPTELGFDGSDMEQAAKVCLYMIAERLALAMLEEEGESWQEWRDGEDEREEDGS